MKYLLSFLVFMAGGLVLAGQDPYPDPQGGAYTMEDLRMLGALSPNSPGARAFDLRYEGVKGTPLLFEDWRTGQFIVPNQDSFSVLVDLNFHLIEKLMYFRLPGGAVGAIPASRIQAARFPAEGGSVELYNIFPEKIVEGGNSDEPIFYQVLFHGQFTLLKEVDKFFREADYQAAYSPDRRYDEYLLRTDYWLRGEGDEWAHLRRLKRKTIEKALPGQVAEIRRITKETGLSLEEEEGLVKVLQRLEQGGE